MKLTAFPSLEALENYEEPKKERIVLHVNRIQIQLMGQVGSVYETAHKLGESAKLQTLIKDYEN